MAGAVQNADLFLKVSSFTRYLLDEVLPAEVNSRDGIQIDMIDNLVEECDALVVSLRTFTQLTKVLEENATVTTNLQTNNGNFSGFETDKHFLKFTELCAVIRKKVASISDLIKFKPYYCKICNLSTWYEHVFNQHCASKRHVVQTNQAPEPLTIYKCKICHLLLMAPQSEINSIVSIPGHILLDEHIQKFKENAEKIQAKNGAETSNYKSSPVKINHNEVIPEVTEDKDAKSNTPEVFWVPKKMNQLFQLMKSKLKTDFTLPEEVPHYCHVCDVMTYSVSMFIEHSSSKDHISAVNSAMKPINVFKCEKCGFLIIGYQIVIDIVKSLNGHQEFDEYIKFLKTTKETGNILDENVTLVNDTEVLSSNISIDKETTKRSLIPEVLKNAINNLLEKLWIPSDLKKGVPSYCYICSKLFFYINDFKQHTASKKHNAAASSVAIPLHVHNCDTCLISLCGTDSDISMLIDSLEHNNLHKKIENISYYTNVTSDKKLSVSDQDIPKFNSSLELKSVSYNTNESKSQIPNETELGSNLSVTSCSQDVKKDKKGNLTPVNKCSKHGIPEKFRCINTKLQCENFTKCGYCRPCSKGVNIKKGWATHLLSNRHLKTMEKIQFENIPTVCNYCPLQIFGDEIGDSICMEFHMKHNHPNVKSIESKSDSFVKDKMIETLSDECSVSSSDKSVSPARIESNDSSFMRRNSSELRAENKELHLTNDNNTCNQTDLTNLTRDLYANQHSFELGLNQELDTTATANKDICFAVFIQFMEKRKTIFLNEGLKRFGGMCLLCAQTFEDYYDWLVHLKDSCNKNLNYSDIVERECRSCNLSLYGRKTVIDTEFWSLEEHVSLDSLITQ